MASEDFTETLSETDKPAVLLFLSFQVNFLLFKVSALTGAGHRNGVGRCVNKLPPQEAAGSSVASAAPWPQQPQTPAREPRTKVKDRPFHLARFIRQDSKPRKFSGHETIQCGAETRHCGLTAEASRGTKRPKSAPDRNRHPAKSARAHGRTGSRAHTPTPVSRDPTALAES